MKKFLLLTFGVTAMLFWGCREQPNEEPVVDTQTTEVNLPASSASGSISFKTNHEWTATVTPSSSSAWLTVTPASGGEGDNVINIKAADNEGYDDRSAVIKIESSAASASIDVLQKQKNALLISKNKYEVGQEGGTVEIEVQANIDYVVEIRDADKEWISDVSSRALTTSAVKLTIGANADYDGREGEVVIREKDGALSETVSIFQGQRDALVLGGKEVELDYEGGEFEVELKTNIDYDVTISASWIKEVTTRSMRNDMYTFTAERLEGYDSRTATITFKAGGSSLQDVLTVTQTPSGAVFVTQTIYNVAAGGETIAVKVSANVELDVVINGDAGQWITNATATSALEEHTYLFRIAANPLNDGRTGTITFRAKGGSLSDEVTVNQYGQSTLIISPSEINVDASRHVVGVELKRNVEYDITFRDSWVRRNTTTSSVITESLELVIDANGTYDPRSTEVVFKDRNSDLSQTLVINQEQRNGLVLSQTTYRVQASENTVGIKVSSNIPHTFEVPSEYGSWITYASTADTRGLVENTYYFLIGENSNSSERIGEIVFESAEHGIRQPVTIIQYGSAAANLTVSPSSLSFGYAGTGQQSVTVTANKSGWTWTRSSGSDWCTVSQSGNTLWVGASQNPNTSTRSASITVTLESITRTVTVTQDAAPVTPTKYTDKQVVQLQQATKGSGVNVVIMGDGFTDAHMEPGGKYETSVKLAMEHYFSVYPFTVYRDYFNVYMVVGVSNGEGVSTATKTVDTRFGSKLTGNGTEIQGNNTTVRTYAGYAVSNTANTNVIMVLNSTSYAGTCYMFTDGFSVGYCPMSNNSSPNYNFKALVVHECGGHGFAHLMDEYVYYNSTITTSYKNSIQSYQNSYGWYMNVDFTSNTSQILWKDFIGQSKYPMVGAYEGAYMYAYGIWRPENNSCMNDNVDYFNAQSRWMIVKRIMELGNVSYSFSQFLTDDQIIPASYAPQPASVEPFIPLAPPVVVESW